MKLKFGLLFLFVFFLSCSHNPANKAINFDKIIFSTSGCMLTCPVTNIIIGADGTVVFKGQGSSTKYGLYIGRIPKELYQRFDNNFRKANIDALKGKYQSQVSDQRTVSTTFVKNGRIYKTVDDYGEIAPASFRSSYAGLENLYKTLALTKDSIPKLIPLFEEITTSKLKKGNMVLDFTQSETFLLSDYLKKGEITINNFHPRFILHFDHDVINPLYNVETDGRFFKFIVKGKPVIIDIGFNFYDVNTKIWQWRQAGEYD